jgi:hypothetical protein
MNIKNAAAIAALTILAGAPALALANTYVPSPITIGNVDIQPQISGTELNTPGSVSLAFRNVSNVAATDVTFDLNSFGATVARIHDVGTFSPGATIRHRFTDSANASTQTVRVAEVKFADGTVWHGGDAVAAHAMRQAVSMLDSTEGL